MRIPSGRVSPGPALGNVIVLSKASYFGPQRGLYVSTLHYLEVQCCFAKLCASHLGSAGIRGQIAAGLHDAPGKFTARTFYRAKLHASLSAALNGPHITVLAPMFWSACLVRTRVWTVTHGTLCVAPSTARFCSVIHVGRGDPRQGGSFGVKPSKQ